MTSTAFLSPPADRAPDVPGIQPGAALTASQLAAVAASSARLDRARAHAARLDAHAADLRNHLDAAAGDGTAGPLRGELVEVERQRRHAAGVLAAVEAEHARHAADLASMYGADGAARAALRERQAERDAASAEADEAGALLNRASAHREAVEGRRTAARADEARHDADAAGRLHAALRDGTEPPTAAEPLVRISAGIEDDLRAANAAEARAASGHRARLAALAGAERQVAEAVDAVLLADADAVAAEVATLDARAAMLRGRLAAYADRTASSYVAPPSVVTPATLDPGGWYVRQPSSIAAPPRIRQSPAVAAALAVPFNMSPIGAPPAEAEAWIAWAAALATDAGAEGAFPRAAAPARAPTMAELSGMPAPFVPPIRAA